MGRRKGLSGVLIVGALVLVAAIYVGNTMGNRVVGDIVNRSPSLGTTPIPSPSVSAEDSFATRALLRRRQALSVATDPAFPDPRITPEPYVPPTPRPVPRPKRTPSPRPTPRPLDTPDTTYTAPPEPVPTASSAQDDNNAPGDAVSPGFRPTASPPPRTSTTPPGRPGANQPRPYSTLPPVTQPTLLP